MVALALFGTTGCGVRPGYLPAPARALAEFSALRRPLSDLPVGAQWIQGHGPYGPGAGLENLENIKTLTTLAFDGGVQASFSLGVLQYLDLDPSLGRKMTARLNDVSIVRVKDMKKLAGPSGQARIYEALKAASITVTASQDVGLRIETSAAKRNLPVLGRGTTGRVTTLTIEAKDVFFAVKIGRFTKADSEAAVLKLPRTGAAHDYLAGRKIAVSAERSTSDCPSAVSLSFVDDANPEVIAIPRARPMRLATPILLKGVLYENVKWASASDAAFCDTIRITLLGTKFEKLDAGIQ